MPHEKYCKDEKSQETIMCQYIATIFIVFIMSEPQKDLYSFVLSKASLKQDVYANTLSVFGELKSVLQEVVNDMKSNCQGDKRVEFHYRDRGDFQAELRIAGDVLIFHMHTNVFQFDKSNSVWHSSYIKENESNSFVGIINVYNFLADSFKYQRIADQGYLIARMFVNREKHFMVQGKRQLGYQFNDFINSVIDKEKMRALIESAIWYILEFDLYTPPYENMQLITVDEIQSVTHSSNLATGKRLGFRFGLEDEL